MWLILILVTASIVFGLISAALSSEWERGTNFGGGTFLGIIVSVVIFLGFTWYMSHNTEEFVAREDQKIDFVRQVRGDPCHWIVATENHEYEFEECSNNFQVKVVESPDDVRLVYKDDLSGGFKDFGAVMPARPKAVLYVMADDFNNDN